MDTQNDEPTTSANGLGLTLQQQQIDRIQIEGAEEKENQTATKAEIDLEINALAAEQTIEATSISLGGFEFPSLSFSSALRLGRQRPFRYTAVTAEAAAHSQFAAEEEKSTAS